MTPVAPELLTLLRAIDSLRPEEGPANLAVVEHTLRAGAMPALHAHPAEEAYLVTEGSLLLHVGRRAVLLEAGDAHVVPAGVPHTYRAESRRVRYTAMAFVSSVTCYERFLHAVAPVAQGSPPRDVEGWVTSEDAAPLAVLASELGITLLGPPGALAVDISPSAGRAA